MNLLSQIVVAAIITVTLLTVLLMIRNQLVYNWRMRRLREVYRAGLAAIARGDHASAALFSVDYDRRSYDEMLWDLTRWTYRSFYPDEPGATL